MLAGHAAFDGGRRGGRRSGRHARARPAGRAPRGDRARRARTTVLVIGGPPGAAGPISPFEHWYAATPAYEAGDYARAYEIASQGLADHPEQRDAALQPRLLRRAGRRARRRRSSTCARRSSATRARASGRTKDEDLASVREELPAMNVVGAPMRDYYERRAREYDDWWLGTGLFARRERPGWHEEVQRLIAVLEALAAGAHARRRLRHRLPHAAPAGRRHRPGPERHDGRDRHRRAGSTRRAGRGRAAAVRRRRVRAPVHQPLLRPPAARRGGRALPRRGAPRRRRAGRRRRRAPPRRRGRAAGRSAASTTAARHQVYKRRFRGSALAEELGGGEVLHDGDWFVAVRAGRARARP